VQILKNKRPRQQFACGIFRQWVKWLLMMTLAFAFKQVQSILKKMIFFVQS
jgi:hypothetical protein